MSRGTALLLSTMIATAVSGAYWLSFFALAYGLTAGDYRPGDPHDPGDMQRRVTAWLIWGSGFVVFAGLAWLWRRIDFRLATRG